MKKKTLTLLEEINIFRKYSKLSLLNEAPTSGGEGQLAKEFVELVFGFEEKGLVRNLEKDVFTIELARGVEVIEPQMYKDLMAKDVLDIEEIEIVRKINTKLVEIIGVEGVAKEINAALGHLRGMSPELIQMEREVLVDRFNLRDISRIESKLEEMGTHGKMLEPDDIPNNEPVINKKEFTLPDIQREMEEILVMDTEKIGARFRKLAPQAEENEIQRAVNSMKKKNPTTQEEFNQAFDDATSGLSKDVKKRFQSQNKVSLYERYKGLKTWQKTSLWAVLILGVGKATGFFGWAAEWVTSGAKKIGSDVIKGGTKGVTDPVPDQNTPTVTPAPTTPLVADEAEFKTWYDKTWPEGAEWDKLTLTISGGSIEIKDKSSNQSYGTWSKIGPNQYQKQ
jgi:hypothetical protein